MFNRLQYRRQFLLTRSPITALADWNSLQIGPYHLSVHPDLELTRAGDAKKVIVLLGSLFDPNEPEKTNAGILADIGANVDSLESLFSQIKPYVGVYVLLYKDGDSVVVVQDSLSLREVYYSTVENQSVCGSQPNLLVKFSNPELGPTSDPDLLNFYRNELRDYSWIGDETYYQGVRHLLPNHYLDVNKREVRRYWPTQPIARLALEEAVFRSCAFLKGTMRAMANRYPLMMAITAGTDSRTLLAASKDIREKIYFFINNEGMGHDHPDISVPKNMFRSIGVPFHVHDVPTDPVDERFRQIFLNNTFLATERILPTIYNVYFKTHADKVNILGTGEIGRTRFGKDPRKLNPYRIAYKLGYPNSRYVIRQSEQILAELLPVGKKFRMNVLSLLHWEHNKGNRWVVGNSESDIAIEEIDPFDSHLLYEFFWAVDDRYTKNRNNVLFREMIHHMWPELLDWPINPPHTVQDKVKWLLGEVGAFPLLKELQYRANYLRYFRRARPQSR